MCVLSLCLMPVQCAFPSIRKYMSMRMVVCVIFLIWIVPCVMPLTIFYLFILLSFRLATRYHSGFCRSHSNAAPSLSRICLYRYFTENFYFNQCLCRRHTLKYKNKNKTKWKKNYTQTHMQRRREPIGKYEIIYGKIN